MNNFNSKDTSRLNNQSRSTLETLYFVIVGLSLVKAIEIFSHSFFDPYCVISVAGLLFLSYIFTQVRFCQGVSLVFSKRGNYPIRDFYGFFFQGIAFYAMASTLNHVNLFISAFVAMLIVDTGWIVLISYNKNWYITEFERQWIDSNFVLFLFLGFLVFIDFGGLESQKHIHVSLYIFFWSCLASIWDWCANKDFYTLKKNAKELKFSSLIYRI